MKQRGFNLGRLVVAAVWALAASAGASSLRLAPCPGFAETGEPPLVYGAECGELAVGENPADPNSRQIKLKILRLPAINPAPKTDPLVLIQGGPGGSSVAMAEQVQSSFAEVRKNRDLIFVDQRGTGDSSPLTCEALSSAEQQLPEVEQNHRYLALTRACAQKYADGSRFYTTPYAAWDLEQVRLALGYSQLNLWGGSYGTRVALEYLREYPKATRTLVLDGLAPAAIALPRHLARTANDALAKINAQCAADGECQAQYGDLLVNAQQVVAQLRAAEAATGALHIDYEDPRTQAPRQVQLSSRAFSRLVFMSLYSRDLSALLPQVLAKAASGDYRTLASLFALASEQTSFLNIAEGMRYSVICNEDAHFYGPTNKHLGSASDFLGLDMTQDVHDICDFWPKAQLNAEYFEPVVAAVPALLLSGAVDPVTPKPWAEQVAQTLRQAQLLEAPGGHHIVSFEGCIPQLIARFIDQTSLRGVDTACVQKIKPLPLVLGADGSASSASPSSSSANSAAREVQP